MYQVMRFVDLAVRELFFFLLLSLTYLIITGHGYSRNNRRFPPQYK